MKGLQPSREPGGPGGAAPSKPLVEQTEPVDFSSRCPDDADNGDNDGYGDFGDDNSIMYQDVKKKFRATHNFSQPPNFASPRGFEPAVGFPRGICLHTNKGSTKKTVFFRNNF